MPNEEKKEAHSGTTTVDLSEQSEEDIMTEFTIATQELSSMDESESYGLSTQSTSFVDEECNPLLSDSQEESLSPLELSEDIGTDTLEWIFEQTDPIEAEKLLKKRSFDRILDEEESDEFTLEPKLKGNQGGQSGLLTTNKGPLEKRIPWMPLKRSGPNNHFDCMESSEYTWPRPFSTFFLVNMPVEKAKTGGNWWEEMPKESIFEEDNEKIYGDLTNWEIRCQIFPEKVESLWKPEKNPEKFECKFDIKEITRNSERNFEFFSQREPQTNFYFSCGHPKNQRLCQEHELLLN
jgi:hypothetical protein